MPQLLTKEQVLARYDQFFLLFYNLCFKHVIKRERVTTPAQLPMGANDAWMEGRIRLAAGFRSDKGAYAMLSDRLCAGVKINVYLRHNNGGFDLQFQISPTYLTDEKRKKLEQKVIPTLQAAKFELKYP